MGNMEIKILSLAAALLFGIGYNWLTGYLEEKRYAEGETSLLVAGGVMATLLFAVPFIGWLKAGIVLLLFVITGTPMIVGSKIRQHRDMVRARGERAKLNLEG